LPRVIDRERIQGDRLRDVAFPDLDASNRQVSAPTKTVVVREDLNEMARGRLEGDPSDDGLRLHSELSHRRDEVSSGIRPGLPVEEVSQDLGEPPGHCVVLNGRQEHPAWIGGNREHPVQVGDEASDRIVEIRFDKSPIQVATNAGRCQVE